MASFIGSPSIDEGPYRPGGVVEIIGPGSRRTVNWLIYLLLILKNSDYLIKYYLKDTFIFHLEMGTFL